MQILILILVIGSVLASTLLRYIWSVDAGDLTSAAFLNQLAHPPGYPLYILAGRFIHSVFKLPSIALSLSVSSAAASLVASIVLYRLFQIIYRAFFGNKVPWYLTMMVTLTIAFVPLWWAYSIVQEVFMWSVMFITAVTYVIVKGLLEKEVSRWNFLFGLLLLSLGIFHQYILALLVPVFVFAYWYQYRRIRLSDILIFCLLLPIGFIPYLFFAGNTIFPATPRLWYSTASLRDLFYIAFRQNYGSLTLFGKLGLASLTERLDSVLNYGRDVLFLWNILCVPIVIGIIVSMRKIRVFGLVLLLLFLAFGPGLFLVYPLPLTNLLSHAIFQRFLLYSFPFLGLYLFIGVSYLDNWLKRLTKENTLVVIAMGSIILLIPLLFFYKFYGYFRSLAKYNGLELYSQNILDFIPRRSLLVVKMDPFAMPIEYVSFVKGYKRDTLVIPSVLIEDNSLYALNKNYFKSQGVLLPPESPDRLNSLLFLNQTVRPVYTNFYIEGFKMYQQHGPLYQVTEAAIVPDVNKAKIFYKDAVYIARISKPMFPLYGISEIQKYLERSINFYINYFSKRNDLKNVLTFYKLLNRVEPTHESQYALGVVYYKMRDCNNTYTVWEQGFKQYTEPLFAKRLSQLSAACFKDLRKANFWNVVYEYAKKNKYGK